MIALTVQVVIFVHNKQSLISKSIFVLQESIAQKELDMQQIVPLEHLGTALEESQNKIVLIVRLGFIALLVPLILSNVQELLIALRILHILRLAKEDIIVIKRITIKSKSVLKTSIVQEGPKFLYHALVGRYAQSKVSSPNFVMLVTT